MPTVVCSQGDGVGSYCHRTLAWVCAQEAATGLKHRTAQANMGTCLIGDHPVDTD